LKLTKVLTIKYFTYLNYIGAPNISECHPSKIIYISWVSPFSQEFIILGIVISSGTIIFQVTLEVFHFKIPKDENLKQIVQKSYSGAHDYF